MKIPDWEGASYGDIHTFPPNQTRKKKSLNDFTQHFIPRLVQQEIIICISDPEIESHVVIR